MYSLNRTTIDILKELEPREGIDVDVSVLVVDARSGEPTSRKMKYLKEIIIECYCT